MSLPELWKHQKLAINAAKDRNSYGLLFEAGTGKSRTVIDILRQKCANEGKLLNLMVQAKL